MTIIITGAKGRLGSLLAAQLGQAQTVIGIDIDELDITDRAKIGQLIGDISPVW